MDLNWDLCNMDYSVIELYVSNSAVMENNRVIRATLLKNSWMEEVFNNQVISIIKNNKLGEDCIG
jgi:hypothetical protein